MKAVLSFFFSPSQHLYTTSYTLFTLLSLWTIYNLHLTLCATAVRVRMEHLISEHAITPNAPKRGDNVLSGVNPKHDLSPPASRLPPGVRPTRKLFFGKTQSFEF